MGAERTIRPFSTIKKTFAYCASWRVSGGGMREGCTHKYVSQIFVSGITNHLWLGKKVLAEGSFFHKMFQCFDKMCEIFGSPG